MVKEIKPAEVNAYAEDIVIRVKKEGRYIEAGKTWKAFERLASKAKGGKKKNMGRLFRTLRKKGLSEETIWLVYSKWD